MVQSLFRAGAFAYFTPMIRGTDIHTYAAVLRDAAARLQHAGIDTAAQEARLLMLAAAGLTRGELISAEQDDVPVDVLQSFGAMVTERCSRRPVQHILGTTSFYGLDLLCDARALIPRPDSECVVETALRLVPEDTPLQVADLGTGSGCLLAAILANRPLACGEGVEAASEAASLARENLEQLSLSGRAGLFEGSWAEWQGWARMDLIVSNPPYIAQAEIVTLAPEVCRHDPLSALDGGVDGLDAYREISSLAARHMKSGAWLVFEIGYDQKDAVSGLLEMAEFTEIGSLKDLGGNDRVVWGRKHGT